MSNNQYNSNNNNNKNSFDFSSISRIIMSRYEDEIFDDENISSLNNSIKNGTAQSVFDREQVTYTAYIQCKSNLTFNHHHGHEFDKRYGMQHHCSGYGIY